MNTMQENEMTSRGLSCLLYNLKKKILNMKCLKNDIFKCISSNNIEECDDDLSQLCSDFFDLPYSICAKYKKYIEMISEVNKNKNGKAPFRVENDEYEDIKEKSYHNDVISFFKIFAFNSANDLIININIDIDLENYYVDTFQLFKRLYSENDFRNSNEHGYAYISFYPTPISSNNKCIKYVLETDKNKGKRNCFSNLEKNITAIHDYIMFIDLKFDELKDNTI